MLAEQENDFENETYGLTDHRDYGKEEHTDSVEQTAQSENPPQATNTAKSDGGRNEKSNG